MPTIAVRVALTEFDADAGRVAVGGQVEFRPTRRLSLGGDVVLPSPVKVRLTAGEVPPVVDLEQDDALTWAWESLERVRSGRGTWQTFTVSDVPVQGVGETVDYVALTVLDPDTLAPLPSVPTVGEAITAEADAREAADDALTAAVALKADGAATTAALALKANTADLGTAAGEDATAFATAAQGTSADTALTEQTSGRLSEASLSSTFATLAVGTRTAFLGDSMEIDSGGWVYHLSALSGGRVSIAVNAGIGGNTTAQMLARVGDIIARNPDICVIGGVTNDHSQGVAQATTQANIAAIVAAIRAAGILPVVRLTPPCDLAGSSPPWNTVQLRRDQIRRWNSWLASWAAANGIPVLDFYSPLVDPATGGFKAGYTSDGTHPNATGVAAAARWIIDRGLPPCFTLNPTLLGTTKNDPRSMWEAAWGSNGVFAGDANADGVADGWNAGGGGTGIKAITAGSGDVVGYWQAITDPTADWTIYHDSMTPPYAVGDKVAFCGRWRASGTARMRARLQLNNGSAALDFGPLALTTPDGYFYVEAQAATTGATRARTNLTALAGSGEVAWAQVAFINLTALGLA